jgi:hypothetical protein
LIESFYSFNAKIVKKIPAAYTDNSIDFHKLIFFGNFFKLYLFVKINIDINDSKISALKGMTLPETGPVKKTAMFMTSFVKESRNNVNMTSAVLEKGEEIIKTILLCVAGFTPRNNIDVFADIFIAFNGKYPSEFVVWMKLLETMPNFPTPYISQIDKTNFMRGIIRLVGVNLCMQYPYKSNFHQFQRKSQQTLGSRSYSKVCDQMSWID